MPLHLTQFENIPGQPGVYFFRDKKGQILYIGKAKNLVKRIRQYFMSGSLWKRDMLAKAESIDFVSVVSESEALLLEHNLIKKHRPPYNNLIRGDNAYYYIKITHEPFAQIVLTKLKYDDGAIYIGPKANAKELKKLLQFLRQLLQYRGCKTSLFKQGVVCSDFLFQICAGWCVFALLKQPKTPSITQKIDQAATTGCFVDQSYEHYVQRYREIIDLIVSFFAGKTKPLEQEIERQMNESIERQHFEWAAKLRDIYFHLQKFVEKQHVVLSRPLSGRFFKIKKIADRLIFVMFNFFEGKMIDIIRHQQSLEDAEISSVLQMFLVEFGDWVIWLQDRGDQTRIEMQDVDALKDHQTLFAYQDFLSCPKNLAKEIDHLANQALDTFIMGASFEKDSIVNQLLVMLHTRYRLPSYPYRIECCDISHLSGGRTSGGLSVMVGGVLFKKYYRRYKIRTQQTSDRHSDDYAALKELIIRRFSSKEKKSDDMPDLFVLDGGKGQLGVVAQLMDDPEFVQGVQGVQFAALGKGKARHTKGKVIGEKEHLYVLVDGQIDEYEFTYDHADGLLIQLRDEAHRFANSYRKKQMSMEFSRYRSPKK